MADKTTIIFPTDFSDASKSGLKWIREMAEKFDAEVHCVTCVQNPIILQPSIGVAYPTMDDMRGEAQSRLDKFVDEHLADLAHPTRKIVLSGRPADEIVNYANNISAEMIVMATHGRSGLSHILIGSTTENVVRHASCPVLSIRG